MRFYRYKESPYSGMYITLARWCNQPSFFKKTSLKEYEEIDNRKSTSCRIKQVERDMPDLADAYFSLKFSDYTIK